MVVKPAEVFVTLQLVYGSPKEEALAALAARQPEDLR